MEAWLAKGAEDFPRLWLALEKVSIALAARTGLTQFIALNRSLSIVSFYTAAVLHYLVVRGRLYAQPVRIR